MGFFFQPAQSYKTLDMSKTGQVGDFFGGVFGTVLTFIGNLLIVIIFLIQRKQLIEDKEEKKYDGFNIILQEAKKDISNLHYIDEISTSVGQKGMNAIDNLLKTRVDGGIILGEGISDDYFKKPVFMDYLYVLQNIVELINDIEKSTLKQVDKILLYHKINRLYLNKFQSINIQIMDILKEKDLFKFQYSALEQFTKAIHKIVRYINDNIMSEQSQSNI